MSAHRFDSDVVDFAPRLKPLLLFLDKVPCPTTAREALMLLTRGAPVFRNCPGPSEIELDAMVQLAAHEVSDIAIDTWTTPWHEVLKQAIYLYTMETPFPLYMFCNAPLNSQDPNVRTPSFLAPYSPFYKLLMTACLALPPSLQYSGHAWRIVRVRSDRPDTVDMFQNYSTRFEVNKRLSFGSFTSMTASNTVVENLAFGSDRVILLSCSMVQGCRIAPLSAYQEAEEEVLVLPPASFVVSAPPTKAHNVVSVHLKQVVPSPGMYMTPDAQHPIGVSEGEGVAGTVPPLTGPMPAQPAVAPHDAPAAPTQPTYAQRPTVPQATPPIAQAQATPIATPPPAAQAQATHIATPPPATQAQATHIVTPPPAAQAQATPIATPPPATQAQATHIATPPPAAQAQATPIATPPPAAQALPVGATDPLVAALGDLHGSLRVVHGGSGCPAPADMATILNLIQQCIAAPTEATFLHLLVHIGSYVQRGDSLNVRRNAFGVPPFADAVCSAIHRLSSPGAMETVFNAVHFVCVKAGGKPETNTRRNAFGTPAFAAAVCGAMPYVTTPGSVEAVFNAVKYASLGSGDDANTNARHNAFGTPAFANAVCSVVPYASTPDAVEAVFGCVQTVVASCMNDSDTNARCNAFGTPAFAAAVCDAIAAAKSSDAVKAVFEAVEYVCVTAGGKPSANTRRNAFGTSSFAAAVCTAIPYATSADAVNAMFKAVWFVAKPGNNLDTNARRNAFATPAFASAICAAIPRAAAVRDAQTVVSTILTDAGCAPDAATRADVYRAALTASGIPVLP